MACLQSVLNGRHNLRVMNNRNPTEQRAFVFPSGTAPSGQGDTAVKQADSKPAKAETELDKVQLIAGIALMMAFFAWIVILVDRVVMPLVALQGVEVEMPSLHHLPVGKADSIAGAVGLEIRRAGIRVDETVPPGYVVDQSPSAGLLVKRGRIVDAVLSVKPERIHCPNLTGLSARDAKLIADSAGLKLTDRDISYSFYSDYPAGTVVRQSPKPMHSMNKGETIAVTISLGGEPSSSSTPNLLGQKVGEIRFLLLRNRVHLGNVERVVDPTSPPNTIISQEPAPGSPIEPNSRINVRVAVEKK